jgi:lysozyme
MNELQLNQLKTDEGFSRKCYLCTAGHNTAGYGYNLDANPLKLSSVEIHYALKNGIPEVEAERLLLLMVAQVQKELEQHFHWFSNLNEIRRGALINMAYNLGINGLLKFKKFLGFLEVGDYDQAALAGINSLWAKQVKGRAERLMAAIKEG